MCNLAPRNFQLVQFLKGNDYNQPQNVRQHPTVCPLVTNPYKSSAGDILIYLLIVLLVMQMWKRDKHC